ncbi:vWA domain-containing protein [Oceanivirga miroungae]|uniref:VWFA domain-containing protein n=1 Tax=Oceanivirga miroungae TaxID=1130046 RepID=A0A6I8M7Q4_9FUSO|nr:hypothetical protein [Oceanivirga miroungae]VWL85952.1 hypothetical protein OMES3154_01243 [Oceanivirga miroungae]
MYTALKNLLISDFREKEENFSIKLTNNKKIRLNLSLDIPTAMYNHYTSEITINPATEGIYQAKRTFNEALKISNIKHMEYTETKALKLVSRGLNIHECMHSIYTNPYIKEANNLGEKEKEILNIIHNMVEDIFIEKNAVKKYEGLLPFIIFNSVFYERFWKDNDKPTLLEELFNYINRKNRFNYCNTLPKPRKEVDKVYKKIKKVLKKAIRNKNANKRNNYTYKIYELLKGNLKKEEFSVGNNKLHSCSNLSEENFETKDLDGENEDFGWEAYKFIKDVDRDRESEIDINHDDIELNIIRYNEQSINNKEKYSILLKEIRKKYKRIYEQFKNVMVDYDYEIENKKIIGQMIDSRNLVDHKKRYWKSQYEITNIVDFSVMILIDGSGSMDSYSKDIIGILLCLHDILYKYNIKHSIVSHNAIFYENDVNINIYWDYNSNNKESSNILEYEPNNSTRDGIVLRWANKYILEKQNSRNPLLFIISDGLPSHVKENGKVYSVPYIIDDIKDSILDMKKNGIKTYPLAFNTSYEDLEKLYGKSYRCDNPNMLINNLFSVIYKKLIK